MAAILKNLKSLLGDGKKEKAISPQDGIQQLRDVEEMLNKKSEFIEKQIDDQLNIAKGNSKKNKRVALQALKKKKRLEKSLQQIDGTLSTVELQREMLENATTNAEVFKVIAQTSKSLQSIHKDLDIDKIDEIMDEISEQQQISEEIQRAIASPIGGDIDEDELLQELEMLEEEELHSRLIHVPTPTADVELPSIPTAEPSGIARPTKIRQAEDEEDMQELAMWAS